MVKSYMNEHVMHASLCNWTASNKKVHGQNVSMAKSYIVTRLDFDIIREAETS